jgi:hypothetical protein
LGISSEAGSRFVKLAVGFQGFGIAVAEVGIVRVAIEGRFIVGLSLVEAVGEAVGFAKAKIGRGRVLGFSYISLVKRNGRLVFAMQKAFIGVAELARRGAATQRHRRAG